MDGLVDISLNARLKLGLLRTIAIGNLERLGQVCTDSLQACTRSVRLACTCVEETDLDREILEWGGLDSVDCQLVARVHNRKATARYIILSVS